MALHIINRDFKANALFNYGTQLVSVMAGFAFVAIATKYAGVESYGRLAMLSALVGVLINLASVRSNEAVINFYRRGKITNDFGLCKMALLCGMASDGLLAVILFVFMKCFSPLIADALMKDKALIEIVSLYCFVIFSVFLRGVPLGLLIAEDRFKFVSVVSCLEPISKLSIVSVFLWAEGSINLESIVWAIVISSAGTTLLVYLLLLKKILCDLRSSSSNWSSFKSYVRFTISTFVSSTLKAGSQGVDVLVVGYLLTPSMVGVYALFKQFLAPLGMLAGPFSTQFYPRIVDAVHHHRKREIRQAIVYGQRVLGFGFVLLLLASMIGLVFFSVWSELEFSKNYYFSYVVLSVGVFLNQQLWWARAFSLVVNPRFSIYAGIIALIHMVAVFPILIIYLDLFGACLGVCALQLVLQFYWNRKLRHYI